MTKTLVQVLLLAAVVSARPAAAIVLGGGVARTDCWSVFAGVTATKGATTVECTDGDPACDTDGRADGMCTFQLRLCTNQPNVATCHRRKIVRMQVKGVTLDRPRLRTLQQRCGPLDTVVVPLGGSNQTKSGKKTIKVTAQARNRPVPDTDTLVLRCLPRKSAPGVCASNGTGPAILDLTGDTGGDFDLGWTGAGHDLPGIPGVKLRFCLTDCNGASDPTCTATATTGSNSPNGDVFGTPLPLVAGDVPLCLVHRYADTTLSATANVQTGVVDFTRKPLSLHADVFRTEVGSVCPRCTGTVAGDHGTCDAGPRQGRSCTVGGVVTVGGEPYPLSGDCPPGSPQGERQGSYDLDLPLTTTTSALAGTTPCSGQSKDDACAPTGTGCRINCNAQPPSNGGVSELCCDDPAGTPCFPSSAASGIGRIEREGFVVAPAPAWPDPAYPKHGVVIFNAVSCASATGADLFQNTLGLSGPAAIILPVGTSFDK
jgi:hypothetical protein